MKNAVIKDLIFKGKDSISDLIKKWSNCFHNCFQNYQGLFSWLVIVHGVINHNPGDHSAPDNLLPYYQGLYLAGLPPLTSCYLGNWHVQNSTNCKDIIKKRVFNAFFFLFFFLHAYVLLMLWVVRKHGYSTAAPAKSHGKAYHEYEFSSVLLLEKLIQLHEPGKGLSFWRILVLKSLSQVTWRLFTYFNCWNRLSSKPKSIGRWNFRKSIGLPEKQTALCCTSHLTFQWPYLWTSPWWHSDDGSQGARCWRQRSSGCN